MLSTLWNNTIAQLSAASVADAAAAHSGSSLTLNALITYTGKAVVRLFLAPFQERFACIVSAACWHSPWCAAVPVTEGVMCVLQPWDHRYCTGLVL